MNYRRWQRLVVRTRETGLASTGRYLRDAIATHLDPGRPASLRDLYRAGVDLHHEPLSMLEAMYPHVSRARIETLLSEWAELTDALELGASHSPEKHHSSSLGHASSAALYSIVRLETPSTIVETGTHLGFSTAMMAAACRANGHGRVVTIDIRPNVGQIIPAPLLPFVEFALLKSDYDRSGTRAVLCEASPDMFLHDSDHSRENMNFELRAAVACGARLVACDDADYSLVFADLAKENPGSSFALIDNRKCFGIMRMAGPRQ